MFPTMHFLKNELKIRKLPQSDCLKNDSNLNVFNKKIKKKWKSKFSKIELFCFDIEISENMLKNITKWPPHENLESDGNRNCIVTWSSYSAKVKLRYMKNISHVANFNTNIVLSTGNMFKEAHVIKGRGALGRGFTYAPVLWWQWAVNRQPGSRPDNS